mmetsp:Transcript_9316/g.21144  ORF Transcript_9316/g.21144 Transcript_9316/m.21144 type:complete len:213 (-) Transcript_9316:85-723(-)
MRTLARASPQNCWRRRGQLHFSLRPPKWRHANVTVARLVQSGSTKLSVEALSTADPAEKCECFARLPSHHQAHPQRSEQEHSRGCSAIARKRSGFGNTAARALPQHSLFLWVSRNRSSLYEARVHMAGGTSSSVASQTLRDSSMVSRRSVRAKQAASCGLAAECTSASAFSRRAASASSSATVPTPALLAEGITWRLIMSTMALHSMSTVPA